MSEIKIENVRDSIKNKVDLNVSRFEGATLSVYVQGSNIRKRPNQVGTAFVFEYKNFLYLATARHVIEEKKKDDELWFLSKLGKFYNLNDIRSDDGFEVFDADIDYHVIRLNRDCLEVDSILCLEGFANRPYTLTLSIGYPNSKNKARINRQLQTGAMTGLRQIMFDKTLGSADSELPDYPHHFVLPWDGTNFNEVWIEVESISLKGMSGAPCFNIKFSEQDVLFSTDPYSGTCLIGLLIEKNKHFVKFVKIKTILSMIPS